MDFTRALTYPFDDQDWLKKLGIGVLITLGGALLSFILLIPLLLMTLLFAGWQFEIIKRVRHNDPVPLPEWDFGGMLGKGVTLVGAQIIYQIPTLIFACIASAVWLLPALGMGDGDAAAALGGVATIISVCCGCIIVLYAIAAGIVYWGGLIRYVGKEEFGTFFEIGENFAIVKNNIGDFGMALVFSIVAGMIGGVISGTAIGGLVVPTFNAYFVGHILGQLAAKVSGEPAPMV